MNLTIWRGTGAHRSATPSELRAENRTLRSFQTAADDFFDRLIEDRDAVHEAFEKEQGRRIDAEVAAACLTREVTALRSELANLRAVSAPVGVRDVDPDDRPTEPTGIPVRTLRDDLGSRTSAVLAIPAQRH